MLYRRIRVVAEEKDLLIPVRTYSKTRIIRMAAYDRAKPTEPFPKASDTFTAMAILTALRILYSEPFSHTLSTIDVSRNF